MLRLWCSLSVLARNILFLYLEAAQASKACRQALWTKNLKLDPLYFSIFFSLFITSRKRFLTFRIKNLIMYRKRITSSKYFDFGIILCTLILKCWTENHIFLKTIDKLNWSVLQRRRYILLKFRYFEGATKFEKITHLFWHYILSDVKTKWKVLPNFCGLLRILELNLS